MNKFKKSWNETYGEKDHFWGELADEPLVRYSCLLPPGGRVLDLGCGDGRNLFYFARKGFDVHGIDFSETAVIKCCEQAVKEDLPVTVEAMDIRDFNFINETWDLIIVPMVLHAMKLSESMRILDEMKKSTKPNGFNYVSVIAVGDSTYYDRKKRYHETEPNTLHIADKEFFLHYFKKEELEDSYKSWKLIYSAETESLRLRKRWKKTPMQRSLYFMGQKVSVNR